MNNTAVGTQIHSYERGTLTWHAPVYRTRCASLVAGTYVCRVPWSPTSTQTDEMLNIYLEATNNATALPFIERRKAIHPSCASCLRRLRPAVPACRVAACRFLTT